MKTDLNDKNENWKDVGWFRDESENDSESSFYQIKNLSKINLNKISVFKKLKNLSLQFIDVSSKFRDNNAENTNKKTNMNPCFKSSSITKINLKNLIYNTINIIIFLRVK